MRFRHIILFLLLTLCFQNRVAAQVLDKDYPYTGYTSQYMALLCFQLPDGAFLGESSSIYKGSNSNGAWLGCKPDVILYADNETEKGGLYKGGDATVVMLDCADPVNFQEGETNEHTGGSSREMAVSCDYPTLLLPDSESVISIYKGGLSNDYFVSCLEKPAIIDFNLPMYQGSRSYEEILSCDAHQLGKGTLFVGGVSREIAIACDAIITAGGGPFFGGLSAFFMTDSTCFATEEGLTGENTYGGNISRPMAIACETDVILGEPATGYYRGGAAADDPAVNCYAPPCLDLQPAEINTISAMPICTGHTLILEASPAHTRKWQRKDNQGEWDDYSTDDYISLTESGDFRLISFGATAGCADTSAVFYAEFVTSIPKPIITVEGSTTICADGKVALRSSAAHQYQWSNGAATQTIWVTEAGFYEVTITDINGCSATSDAVEIQKGTVSGTPATITPSGTLEICAGTNQTLTTNAASAYVWSNGATSQSISVSQSGKYTVRITDSEGCQATADSVEVIVHNIKPVVSHPQGLMICYGESVILSLAPHTGNIQWYTDNTLLTGETGTEMIVTSTGKYHAVLDTLGCQFAAVQVEVLSNGISPKLAAITASHPVLCQGGNVTLTAAEASEYSWSDGSDARSIWMDAAGTYTVTVKDEYGCPSTASYTLTEVPVTIQPVIQAPDNRFDLCPGASVTLTVSEGSTFEWNTGATTQQITVDFDDAGAYSVVAYDNNGCAVAADAIEVVQDPELTPVIEAGYAVICGSEPLALSAMPSDASYTYAWSNGATTPDIDITTAGGYSVTITTAAGCQFTSAPVTVTQVATPVAPVISANYTITNDTVWVCPNQLESVTLSTPAANVRLFEWSTGDETQSITPGSEGKYAVMVEYNTYCPAVSDTVVIALQDNLVSISVVDDITGLCPGGSITLNIVGAEEGSTFVWNGNTAWNQASLTITAAGTYSATVTGPGGCVETTDPVEIYNHPVTTPVIASGNGFNICPYDSTEFIVSESEAYLWNTGEDTRSIYAKKAGTYSVDVTDRYGCMQTATAELTVKPSYSPVIFTAKDTICQRDELQLTVSAPAGSTFAWSTGETTSSITFNNPSRFGELTYWVEVNYPEGCTFRTPDKLIYVNKAPRQPDITVVGSNNICPDLTVALIATKSDDYDYLWRMEKAPDVWENYPDGNTFGIVVDENGNYDVTITDKNTGCSTRSEILELTSLSSAEVQIYPKGPESICKTGWIKLEAFASQQDVTYKWNTGEDSKSIIVNQEGYYRVVVTALVEGQMCEIQSKRVEIREGSMLPPPVISVSGPLTFCEGERVTLTSTMAPNGKYEWLRWTPADSTMVGTWQQLEVAESGEYRAVFTDNKGCKVVSKPVRITVNPLPEAVISPDGMFTVCGTETIALSANAGSGHIYQWYRNSVAYGASRTIDAGVGIYDLKVTNPQGCSKTSIYPVEIRLANEQAPMPMANDTGICTGEKAVLTLSSSIDEPQFKWWDAAAGGNVLGYGNTFETPVLNSDYEIWVNVSSDNYCESGRRKVTVSVGQKVPVSITTPDNISICNFDKPVALSATPVGGTFSGEGVIGSTFDPVEAGAGMRKIIYTVTNHGCPSKDSIEINVLPAPQIYFQNIPATICANESPILIDVNPAGGVLLGNGVNGMIFDPQEAGAGEHWLVYSITEAGCRRKDSVSITVLPVPHAVISSHTTVGVEGGSFELIATPAGGTFAVTTGVTINGEGKAFFNPAVAGVGEHEVIYTLTGVNGCEGSTIFTITVVSAELPDVVTPAVPGGVCENSLLTVTPPTYELHGATIISKGWLLDDAPFDPATDRVTYADNGKLLRYKVVSSAGTGVSEGVTITVNAVPLVGDINNGLPVSICAGNTLNVSVPSVTTRGAAVNNAYWMFNGALVDLSTKVFAVADHGKLLKYMAESDCGPVEGNAIVVNVYALPAPVISGATTVCENANITYGIDGLTWNATDYTYDWAVTGNGTIQGSNTNVTITIKWTSGGLHALNVTVADIATGCTAGTSISTIAVNPAPVFTVTDPPAVCVGNTIDLTASVPADASVTYMYYELDRTTVVATPTALVVPATNATYFVQATDKVTGCQSDMTAINVTGNPVPAVSFGQQSQEVCDGSATTEVTFTSTLSGTTYTWTNNNTNIGLEASGNTGSIPSFTATNTGSSPVTATIAVTPTVGSCMGTQQTFTITVNPNPTFTVTDPAPVCEGSNVNLAPSVPVDAAVDYIFYESDQSTVVSTPTTIAAAAGSTTYYAQSVGKTTGCRSVMQAITITANPMPAITVTHPDAVCIGTAVNLESAVPADAAVTYTFFESDQVTTVAAPSNVIAPAGTHTYYVQLIDANMCRSVLAPITVSVSAMPTVSIESVQDIGSVCHNGTITLTAVTTGDIDQYDWYDSKGNAENGLQFSPNTHEATVVYNPAQADAGTEIKLSVRVGDRVCGYADADVRMDILPLSTSASFELVTQPVAYQKMCADTVYEVKVKATDIGDLANVKIKLHDINATQIVIKEASVKQPYTSGTWEPLDVSESDLTGTTWILPNLVSSGDSVLVSVTVASGCNFFSGSSLDFNLFATTVCGDHLPGQILTTEHFHIEQDSGPMNTFDITSTFSPDKVTNLTSDIVTWRLKAVVHGNYTTDSNKETMVVLIPTGLTVIDDSYVPEKNAPTRAELKMPVVDEFGVELGIPVKSGLTEGDEIIAELKFHVTGASCGIYDFYGEIYHTGTVDCNGTECEFNSTRGGVYPTLEVERYRYSGADTLVGRTIGGLWYGENYIVAETPFYDGDEILVDFYIDKDNDGKLTTGTDQLVYTHTFLTSAANIGDILVDRYEKIPFEKGKQLLAVVRGGTVCENPYVIPIATIAGTDTICRLDTAYYYVAPDMENYSWTVVNPTGTPPVRIPLEGSTAANYNNENIARFVWTNAGDYTIQALYDMPGNPVREMQPTYFPVHVNEQPEVTLARSQDTTVCEGTSFDLSRFFRITGVVDADVSYYRIEEDGSQTFLSDQTPVYVSPTTSTTYKAIAVSRSTGCTSLDTAEFDVNVSAMPQIVNISAEIQPNCGEDTGEIMLTIVGGSGDYEYNLDNGSSFTDLPSDHTIKNLPVGDYQVYLREKTSGCPVSISEPISLNAVNYGLYATVEVTDATDCHATDGTIKLIINGGTAPYQYKVNQGSYTALPANGNIGSFAAGTYSITVTDTEGRCITTAGHVKVNTASGFAMTLTQTPADCNTPGTLKVSLSGGTPDYRYRLSGKGWMTMTGNSEILLISAGLHHVYAEDSGGCEVSDTIRIDNVSGLKAYVAETTKVSCNGSGSGDIHVNIVGGANPLTYSMDGGNNFINIDAIPLTVSMPVGTYQIQVKDDNGCVDILEGIRVERDNDFVALSVTSDTIKICTTEIVDIYDLAIISTSTNVDTVIFFTDQAYQNPLSDNNIYQSGTYYVRAESNKGCFAYDSVHVKTKTIAPPVITWPSEACVGDQVVFLTEQGHDNYLWEIEPGTGGVIDGSSTTYNVTITWSSAGQKLVSVTVADANGCEGEASATIDIKLRIETGPIYRVPNNP